MPYILEPMTPNDIQQVSSIERLCFSMPWPISAYRRELRTPETNRYIVARFLDTSQALRSGLPSPTVQNLTTLVHPELHLDGHVPERAPDAAGRSVFASILPWLRSTRSIETPAPPSEHPIVGYAGLWLMIDEAHVTTIGVHPDQRGHGVGEFLFMGLVDIAVRVKAVRVTLEVRVSNTNAQALYRKYGLEIAGIRRHYYSDNGEDAYIMWSEPVASIQFKERIARLREQLASRMQQEYADMPPPARPVDHSRLQ